jgi:hypothetical protein
MFNWLTSRFPRRPADRPRTAAPHLEAVAAHNQVLSPDLSLIDLQARVYQQSPWVYLAVSRIAEAAALVPLRVYRRVGERQIEIDRHPLNTLLDAPNPTLTRFELFEQTIGMVETLDYKTPIRFSVLVTPPTYRRISDTNNFTTLNSKTLLPHKPHKKLMYDAIVLLP